MLRRRRSCILPVAPAFSWRKRCRMVPSISGGPQSLEELP